MGEFILRHHLLLIKSVEFIAALTGVLLLSRYKDTPVKFFIYFLVLTFLCEVFGYYTAYVKTDKFLHFLIGTKLEKNYWLFTLSWDLGATLFFAFYFYKVVQSKIYKTIIKYLGCFHFVFVVGTILFNWNTFFNSFFDSAFISSTVVILLSCSLYFLELLQSDKILYFYNSISFYIASALLFWWLIITPLTFYDIYFTYEVEKEVEMDQNYLFIRRVIYVFANIVMYLTFTFALIKCKPKKQSSI